MMTRSYFLNATGVATIIDSISINVFIVTRTGDDVITMIVIIVVVIS